ncbi:MAG TPA: GGDEF domain-containing protein [Terracidiphilus sp.]|jgi:diguanylate cyclase (GGDEF)-like protein|nr:GGDEF domain-containing protein [Terracidiphilus sp.]
MNPALFISPSQGISPRRRARDAVVYGILLLLAAAPVLCETAAPGTLNSLAAVSALTNDQASHSMPAVFEGTVVYSRGGEKLQFVQEGDKAVFVDAPGAFQPGDRILVRGRTQNSYRPIVVADKVTLLRHDARPKPFAASLTELITGGFDCRLVTMRGRVRSGDLFVTPGAPTTTSRMQLVTDGGRFEVNIDTADGPALKSLLDADVEVTGAVAGKFNDKMQLTGVVLYVSGLQNIRVLERAAEDPSSLPITPMDRILNRYRVNDLSPRVHVQGTITYYRPGIAAVLQDGARSLWIVTRTRIPVQVGDRADATGFPDEHDRILTLNDGEITDEHVRGVADPMSATWEQLAFWSDNQPVGHQNDLVSIQGQVVTEVREPFQDEFVLDSGGHLFSAILYHADGPAQPLPGFPRGSTVRVTGICTIIDLNTINPPGTVPFEILLRSFADVQPMHGPPLLSTRNLTILAGVLLLIAIVAVAYGWSQERKFHQHSEAMAQLEHRRSRILESINSSHPLAEILEQIAGQVSLTLNHAACWFEIADGARLGRQPANPESFRVESRTLPGQGGAVLGSIFVALPRGARAGDRESQAIEMGGRLAVLAIETQRLYADLTYRSEFDALTGTHNRFSLNRFLSEQIRRARADASIFGLIYLDLDDFKQVNDRYGHQVGDEYLNQVALRMKRQIRPGDLLARLGGDEFAVIVTRVRKRADVEEVAERLKFCFQPPVTVDGHSLSGSVSLGVALYPEDGGTDDLLLTTADGAMYAAKKLKNQR